MKIFYIAAPKLPYLPRLVIVAILLLISQSSVSDKKQERPCQRLNAYKLKASPSMEPSLLILPMTPRHSRSSSTIRRIPGKRRDVSRSDTDVDGGKSGKGTFHYPFESVDERKREGESGHQIGDGRRTRGHGGKFASPRASHRARGLSWRIARTGST